VTTSEANFSGIRFTHLRLLRKNLFEPPVGNGLGKPEIADLPFPASIGVPSSLTSPLQHP
jgi:hypothetical protein